MLVISPARGNSACFALARWVRRADAGRYKVNENKKPQIGCSPAFTCILFLAGPMQLIWGARPPRAQFDAARVEHFAMRATEPKGPSSMVARLADGASARTREGARAPHF
jgi:hypothetical protein